MPMPAILDGQGQLVPTSRADMQDLYDSIVAVIGPPPSEPEYITEPPQVDWAGGNDLSGQNWTPVVTPGTADSVNQALQADYQARLQQWQNSFDALWRFRTGAVPSVEHQDTVAQLRKEKAPVAQPTPSTLRVRFETRPPLSNAEDEQYWAGVNAGIRAYARITQHYVPRAVVDKLLNELGFGVVMRPVNRKLRPMPVPLEDAVTKWLADHKVAAAEVPHGTFPMALVWGLLSTEPMPEPTPPTAKMIQAPPAPAGDVWESEEAAAQAHPPAAAKPDKTTAS